ncbi:hypothetical protein ACHAXR_003542 [Thalassiosira sp. AJA248-18]
MALALFVAFAFFACSYLVEGFNPKSSSSSLQTRLTSSPSVASTHHHRPTQRRGVALNSAPDGMHWFVKTEQFCKPFPEVKPHLEAHRSWVRSLRDDDTEQTIIVSGYRVDENDRPGGGGLMIFAAKDYAEALALVQNDPLIVNECVDWQLNKWIAETGDISVE